MPIVGQIGLQRGNVEPVEDQRWQVHFLHVERVDVDRTLVLPGTAVVLLAPVRWSCEGRRNEIGKVKPAKGRGCELESTTWHADDRVRWTVKRDTDSNSIDGGHYTSLVASRLLTFRGGDNWVINHWLGGDRAGSSGWLIYRYEAGNWLQYKAPQESASCRKNYRGVQMIRSWIHFIMTVQIRWKIVALLFKV